MTALNKQRHRAYTSVMSLMNVMAEKGLLTRKPEGRAFVYEARMARDRTQSHMLRDLLRRVFDGSTSAVVASLLENAEPTSEEMEEIRNIIAGYGRDAGGA